MMSLGFRVSQQPALLEPVETFRSAPALSRQQLIEQIMTLNSSATPGFLTGFSLSSLMLYLDHLQQGMEPRGGSSRWVRMGETPAILARASRE